MSNLIVTTQAAKSGSVETSAARFATPTLGKHPTVITHSSARCAAVWAVGAMRISLQVFGCSLTLGVWWWYIVSAVFRHVRPLVRVFALPFTIVFRQRWQVAVSI